MKEILKYKLSLFILFIGFVGFSQENMVKAEADTLNIRIGEQIQFKIKVNETQNVLFPKFQVDSLGRLEVVKSLPVDTLKNSLEKKYLLTSFDSGQYFIPKQQILINSKQFFTDSLLVNVATVAVDTTKQKMFPIKSIKKEPKTFDDYKHWLWWLIPILVLIAIILYFVLRKKKAQPKSVVYIAPIQEAMQRLKELDEKQLLKENKIKAYYTELTDIVRTYIEKDLKIPALESTTNELIETISDFNESSKLGISTDTIKNLESVLINADLVKFAKAVPAYSNIQTDRSLVEQVLTNTREEYHKYEVAQQNELSSESISVYQKPVKKKSSWSKYLIGFVIFAVIGLSIGGYFGYQYLKENVIGKSTSEMNDANWFTSKYGDPAITISTPDILKADQIEVPEQVAHLFKSFAVFTYGSIMSGYHVGVVTNEFKEGVADNYDLNGGIAGALKEIESRVNSKFTNTKIETIFNNNFEGRKATATIEITNPTTNIKTENNVIILLFGNPQSMRQIIISQLTNDKEADKVTERIINSIIIN
jgi:hypothetical protein